MEEPEPETFPDPLGPAQGGAGFPGAVLSLDSFTHRKEEGTREMDAELKAQALRGDWLAAPPLHPGLPHRAVSRRSAWKTLRSSAKCPQGTRGRPIGHGASTFGRTRNPALSLLRPPGARAEQHTLLLQTPAALTPAQGAPPSAPCPNLPGRLPQMRPASSHAGSPALSPSLQALLGTGPTALHPEPWPRPPPVRLPRAPISNTDPLLLSPLCLSPATSPRGPYLLRPLRNPHGSSYGHSYIFSI